MKLDIHQTLEKLKGKQQTERIQAKYIYQDEHTQEIKEIPISKLDSAASVHTDRTSPAKLIHDSIFHC